MPVFTPVSVRKVFHAQVSLWISWNRMRFLRPASNCGAMPGFGFTKLMRQIPPAGGFWDRLPLPATPRRTILLCFAYPHLTL